VLVLDYFIVVFLAFFSLLIVLLLQIIRNRSKLYDHSPIPLYFNITEVSSYQLITISCVMVTTEQKQHVQQSWVQIPENSIIEGERGSHLT